MRPSTGYGMSAGYRSGSRSERSGARSWRSVSAIAAQELRDAVYNRWLLGFGGLFALLAAAISYFGLASARQIGFQGLGSVSASLLDLVLFTVPLVALSHPAVSFTGQGEGLAILLTQPVERLEILAGKYLGMLGAVSGAILGGLLVGGAVIGTQAGPDYVGDFFLLMALTFGLIAVFLAVGLLIAIVWQDRSRALGICLALWFSLAVLYDLVVFGITVSGPGLPLRVFLVTVLLANPVDSVRVCYLLATGNQSFVGTTGAILSDALGTTTGVILLSAVLLLQAAGGLAAAGVALCRKDF